MAFSFAFSGDDIDVQQYVAPVVATSPAIGAFPVAGRPLLRPTNHDLAHLLSRLPSKVAYSCLDVTLDDGSILRLPRRELWDVRLQLMAEDDSIYAMEALGDHDVKTGVYEGGFKSWESSVDLVKVLAAQRPLGQTRHELALRPDVLQAFSFVQLVDDLPSAIPGKCATPPTTLILGAETIYSPLALEAFIDTILAILERESHKFQADAGALVAAKMLYFGVGGSLSDFITTVGLRGVRAVMLREAVEGVRRGVVHCVVPHQRDRASSQ
ncbi:hypothetical protein CDD80_7113 [Ophiocordyceps camponoti-rufipedis]|uniref:Uncharacterized protein n=1 Tax=Ophiocordyceps camponoti-rufipedis TaxID=2004952 RepID=A0A2C5YPX0_9HYPO|nr:hypothetical protein CDD80_7113 [Ophiocordyceps camponoti-rufipedis]